VELLAGTKTLLDSEAALVEADRMQVYFATVAVG
jgi:hypothetical protein